MASAVDFDYSAPRAIKARLGFLIGIRYRLLIVLLGYLVLALGVLLLLIGWALGWFVFSLAVISYMLMQWYDGELRHLPSGKGNDVIDRLSGDILGQLPRDATPADMARIVGTIASGLFMGARFGLTPNMLSNVASNDRRDMTELWRVVEELRARARVNRYSGSVLAAALLKMSPDYQTIIAQLRLDEDDLITGIRWQQHLRDVAEEYHKPRRTGGVARDWSFGYTPLLTRFGRNISYHLDRSYSVAVQSHQDAVDQLIDTLGSNGRKNAVLVGPTGAGKTTIIQAFASKMLDATAKIPSSLKFRQVFVLDSSALIAAAPGRGELEGLVMRVLSEAYAAKNIIICLDNAQLFFDSGVGAIDLSNVLQPIIEAGNLRIVLSMDEQNYLRLTKKNSALTNALNRISVAPTNEEDTLSVLFERVMVTEYENHVIFTYQSLVEAYRLSTRYVYDVAQPGQSLKLLEQACRYADHGLITVNSVQRAIEQTMDIKVSVASDVKEREKLLNLESLIHERMINQAHAVQVVSDALRRARAGVRNESRPIGTFLFLGPTGVGKTELAKALASVYFDGEENIVRLDLNEYVQSSDVARLIADGADDPLSLTAQVMKRPFSVILLDEIEKAAPEVLTTLLQLLDEGILRDEKNREVSFRDAIVIATSNAGADRIREYVSRGYEVTKFEDQFIDELIDSKQFRPEFLNRFDEIVIFSPLSKDDLMKVVDLIITGVNKTLATQKISVVVAPDAKKILVDRGYDPRLGARPMRRIVQKSVENIVAKAVLAGDLAAGDKLTIDADMLAQALKKKSTSGKEAAA